MPKGSGNGFRHFRDEKIEAEIARSVPDRTSRVMRYQLTDMPVNFEVEGFHSELVEMTGINQMYLLCKRLRLALEDLTTSP